MPSAHVTPADHRFFGHPRGLLVLAASEAWERFSYAGMQTLLVLYAAHALFQPGTIDRIWGRSLIEAVYGRPSPQALASHIFGLYAGLVYLSPIVGGFLADRLIGKTRAVILGAGLLTLGHGLMGFEESFLVALLCLVLGVGCFKTNITSQVGDLYAIDDPRRASAFQIFVLAISVAAVVAPLVCGTLGEKIAWRWGFGAAGVGMVVGLATYLAGRRWLPPEPARLAGRSVGARPKRGAGPKRGADPKGDRLLAPGDGRVILVLVSLLPVLALASVGNEQMFNAYLLWGEQHFRMVVFGWAVPVTWLIAMDSVIAIAAMSASLAFWRWWALRRAAPDEITKLTLGALVCALAPLILAVASVDAAGGRRIGLGWGVAFHVVNELGFANLYPVGLALYSRCAPRALGGTMIAVYFLHMFVSNVLVGALGSLLGTMSGAAFWLLHAGIVGVAAVILLVVRRLAGRVLAPTAPTAPTALPTASTS